MSEPANHHPTDTTPTRPPQGHDRRAIAQLLYDCDQATAQGSSQRDFARQRGLPQATLQRWLSRRDQRRQQHREAARTAISWLP